LAVTDLSSRLNVWSLCMLCSSSMPTLIQPVLSPVLEPWCIQPEYASLRPVSCRAVVLCTLLHFGKLYYTHMTGGKIYTEPLKHIESRVIIWRLRIAIISQTHHNACGRALVEVIKRCSRFVWVSSIVVISLPKAACPQSLALYLARYSSSLFKSSSPPSPLKYSTTSSSVKMASTGMP
jgi:hypothetical protein